MREPCCSVGLSGESRFPRGVTWYVTWLPKGYAPTFEDRMVCAFPAPLDGSWDDCSLSKGKRPPIIEAVCAAIEAALIAEPELSFGRHEPWVEAQRA